MGAVDLGAKHTCGACQCRFYDLGKPSPRCPKCGGAPRVKRPPKAGAKRRKKRPKVEFAEPVRGSADSFDEIYEDPEFLGDVFDDDDDDDIEP